MNKPQPFFTGQIQAIENSTMVPDLSSKFEKQYCRISAWLDPNLNAEFRAARVVMLSGYFRGQEYIFSRVNIVPVDIDRALALGNLCRCAGVEGLHTQDASGCLHTEQGPFCGNCGLPCETISHDLSDHAEHFGTPCRVPYIETKSVCCNSEALYADCNLTQEYTGDIS